MPIKFQYKLKEMIGIPIKIEWFIGDGMSGQVDNTNILHAYGKILEIDDDLLVWEHLPSEAKRIQTKKEYFDLKQISIYNFGELIDDFDDSFEVDCPECDATINFKSIKRE